MAEIEHKEASILLGLEKLEQGASDRADLEGEHKETVAAMERRFFEEKARLQKEYAAQFGAITAQFGAIRRDSAQSFRRLSCTPGTSRCSLR